MELTHGGCSSGLPDFYISNVCLLEANRLMVFSKACRDQISRMGKISTELCELQELEDALWCLSNGGSWVCGFEGQAGFEVHLVGKKTRTIWVLAVHLSLVVCDSPWVTD